MSADFTAVVTNGLVSIKQSGDAAAGALRKFGAGVKATGSTVDEAGKKMRDMGAAVARMGGPLGDVGGKLFGAAGMSGGMRALALGAVAAGVAFKAFNAVMEAATARAQAFAEAAAGIRTAMRGAADARRSFEAGAGDVGKAQARAENVFGKEAGGEASMMARAFGIEQTDMLGAMAGAGTLKSSQRARALEAAATAASTQEMSATEAMDMMKDPATLAAVLAQKAGGGVSAAQRGAAQLVMRRRGRSGPEAMREAIDTVGQGGPARSRMAGIAQAQNITTRGQIAAVTSGATEAAMRTEAARVLNPAAAAMSAWYNQLVESQQKLNDLTRATPVLISALKELTPQGSSETQAMREAIAAGSAITGMGGGN